MKKQLLMTFCAVTLAYTAFAGNTPEGDSTNFRQYELKLETLAHKVLRDTSRVMRDSAHAQLQTLWEQVLKEDGAFNHDFQVEGVSVIKSNDGQLRFFTWQLYQDKDHYKYGGFLQLKDGTVFKLNDKAIDYNLPQFDRMSPKSWYGALYYSVRHFRNKNGKDMYLLFGYNAHSFFNRRKILDVLYFDDVSGKPYFGSPVIEIKDGMGRMRVVHRMVLEYSAAVTVGLKYSEEKNMITYDHLVLGSATPDGAPANIPDGSYEGLQLTDGIWKYVEEVFTENPYYGNDNPPMPAPVLDENSKNKDIFGKKQRKSYRWTSTEKP